MKEAFFLEALEAAGASQRLLGLCRLAVTNRVITVSDIHECAQTLSKVLEALRAQRGFGKKMLLELEQIVVEVAGKPAAIVPDTSVESSTQNAKPVESTPDDPVLIEFAELRGRHPGERLSAATEIVLLRLPAKEKEIVARRYGVSGFLPQTLEEIGVRFKVTRERIRQIEVKAMRKLRKAKLGDAVANVLRGMDQAIWQQLFGDVAYGSSTKTPQPALRLLLDIAFNGTTGFLKDQFTEVPGGFLNPVLGAQIDPPSSARIAAALERLKFPVQVHVLADTAGVDIKSVATFVDCSPNLARYLGYVVSSSSYRRHLRTVRLHALMRSKWVARGVSLASLQDTYLETFADDQCTGRDLLLSIDIAPALFLNGYADGWRALGEIGDVTALERTLKPDGTTALEFGPDNYGDREHAESLKVSLKTLLDSEGPMSVGELREHYRRHGGRSTMHSVGPTLLMNGDFARLAPGVYGLPRQIEEIAHGRAALPEVCMSSKQVGAYVMARWGGDNSITFPIWTPATEYIWAQWGRDNLGPNVYSSLLWISAPERWPASPDEIAWWRHERSRIGRFMLSAPPTLEISLKTISLDQMLSIALHLQEYERLSWVTANMVSGKRHDDVHAAGPLAFLIMTNAVIAGDDWQQVHRAGDGLRELISTLMSRRSEAVGFEAEQSCFAEILGRCSATASRCWLTPWQAEALRRSCSPARAIADLRSGDWRLPPSV